MVTKFKAIKSSMNVIYITLLVISQLIATAAFAQNGNLSASVDREKISIEETLNLVIRFSGRTNSQPDLSGLNNDFTIRNQSTSSQTSIVNGQVNATTEWRLLLEPRHDGKLLIPSFKLDNTFSDAIQIDVTPPQPVPSGTLRDIFLETTIEKSSAYVQEQIKVTYRFYFSVGVESLDKDDFNLPDVVIEALPETMYQRNVSGKEYRVAEYSYAFFPQNSGELMIPALNWRVGLQRASNQRDFFGRPLTRTEIKRLRSEGKTIQIKAKPPEFPASAEWLPATDLRISETWSSEEFKVGEPVTRNITTIAEGLRVEQLPAFLKDENTDSRIKFYTDQAQNVDDKNAQGFVAKRVESAAVVINEPGEVEIPEIRIPWWDVDEDKLKFAVLPAKLIRTTGSAPAATQPQGDLNTRPNNNLAPELQPVTDANTSEALAKLRHELLITRIFLGLSLIALLVLSVLYFLNRQKNTASPKSKNSNSTTALLKACESKSAKEVRVLLLRWASKHWPGSDIKTLIDIADLCNNDALKAELMNLDACLYRGDKEENWDGSKLAKALNDVINSEREANRNKSELAELY